MSRDPARSLDRYSWGFLALCLVASVIGMDRVVSATFLIMATIMAVGSEIIDALRTRGEG